MKTDEPKLEIKMVCELFGVELSHQQAAVFVEALRQAAHEVFPKYAIRGLWVHKGVTLDASYRENDDKREDRLMMRRDDSEIKMLRARIENLEAHHPDLRRVHEEQSCC